MSSTDMLNLSNGRIVRNDSHEILKQMTRHSPFFESNVTRRLPTFMKSEIQLGPKLGRGETGIVFEIKAIDLSTTTKTTTTTTDKTQQQQQQQQQQHPDSDTCIIDCEQTAPISQTSSEKSNNNIFLHPDDDNNNNNNANDDEDNDDDDISELSDQSSITNNNDDDDEYDSNEQQLEISRDFMSHNVHRHGSCRYAIKTIDTHLPRTKKINAMIDLDIEATFLATLSHPNIIKIRGTCYDPVERYSPLILDKLAETLDEKMGYWREQMRGFKKFFWGGVVKAGKRADYDNLMVERMMAALDIARAMRYLHRQNIVYRDLKPENVGFDLRGDCKLFDFGLAKELHPQYKTSNNLYNMSGLTGSRRYMAPEVCLCLPYNHTADVYSFGILLWEILALKTPFAKHDPQSHTEKVVMGGERPRIKKKNKKWSFNVSLLMEACWTSDISKRADFERVCRVLLAEIELMDQEGGMTTADRSTHLMNTSLSSRKKHCYEREEKGGGGSCCLDLDVSENARAQ